MGTFVTKRRGSGPGTGAGGGKYPAAGVRWPLATVRTAIWLWFLLLGSHLAYALLRTRADESFPIRSDYAPAFDALLFGSESPTVWLQQRFYGGLPLAWWEYYFLFTFFSLIVVAVGLPLLLTLTRSRVFPVFAIAMALAHGIALVVHALAPSAPPWVPGVQGGEPAVHRIVEEVLHRSDLYASMVLLSENDVAAMPSLHMTVAAVAGFAIARLGRLGTLWAWIYVLSMGFALVYLGEHYLVDVLGGLLVATTAWGIADDVWARRAARRTGRGPSSYERWSRMVGIPGEPVGGLD